MQYNKKRKKSLILLKYLAVLLYFLFLFLSKTNSSETFNIMDSEEEKKFTPEITYQGYFGLYLNSEKKVSTNLQCQNTRYSYSKILSDFYRLIRQQLSQENYSCRLQVQEDKRATFFMQNLICKTFHINLANTLNTLSKMRQKYYQLFTIFHTLQYKLRSKKTHKTREIFTNSQSSQMDLKMKTFPNTNSLYILYVTTTT